MTALKHFSDVGKFALLIKPFWRYIAVFLISDLLIIILSLGYPWITKMLVDDVLIQQDRALLYPILFVGFLLSALIALMRFMVNYYHNYIQHALSYQIKIIFCKRLLKHSFSFWDSHQVAELLSRLKDMVQSRRLMIQIVNTLANNFLYISVVPLILFFMNWKLALMVVAILPFMVFSFSSLSKPTKRYARSSANMQGRLSALNYEVFSGIREIQSLTIESYILRRLKLVHLKFRKVDMTMRVFGELLRYSDAMLRAGGTLLYTWYGARLVLSGQMSIGELLAFTTFIGYLYTPITALTDLMVPLQEVGAHTHRFFEIYDLKPQITNPAEPAPTNRLTGDIRFENLDFYYQQGLPVLSNINLHIPAGSTIAIVGKTGSGKSTLAGLIPRFYDPTKGRILIDGADVRTLGLPSLRQNIGFVMQHPYLFADTIRANISFGRQSKHKERIECAGKRANAHDFIKKLPLGYDTVLGEKGITLSGGERQRVSLARIFLRNCPILILDEATANVDQRTEATIQSALKQMAGNRTILMITHRLASIQSVDRIIVMDRGTIVEQGSHQELLNLKGYYYHLYNQENLFV
jgi:ABC-type bacteriocin/lantibiotic exporter with double-glycine peptidase domain